MLCYRLLLETTSDLAEELQTIACDPAGTAIMQDKLSALTVKITDLKGYCALALKEAALSAGAECALPRTTIRKPEDPADVLLLCTRAQLKKIGEACGKQAFQQLRELAALLPRCLTDRAQTTPKLMGILNVTPDSLSDGGAYTTVEKAVQHGLTMIAAGADIIDIGGESTRPGAPEIPEAEELQRVIPVITALHQQAPQTTISIDTTKSSVAQAAVAAGATIINDISGLTRDPNIARVAAETGATLVLMHRLAPSATMQDNPVYTDILKDILTALTESIAVAKRAGVTDKQLIVDPGIGFGKTREQNLYLLKQLCAFTCFGYPLLLGTSRKSVIGLTLDKPVQERTLGTAITTALATPYVDYFRVHDIAENKDAVRLAQAIRGATV